VEWVCRPTRVLTKRKKAERASANLGTQGEAIAAAHPLIVSSVGGS
jgi:hypothetical protein